MVFVLRPVTVNLALLGLAPAAAGRARVPRLVRRARRRDAVLRRRRDGLGALSGAEAELITWTAIATVILSVVLHGVTAGPLNRWLVLNVLNPR